MLKVNANKSKTSFEREHCVISVCMVKKVKLCMRLDLWILNSDKMVVRKLSLEYSNARQKN